MNYTEGSLDLCLDTVPDDINVIIVNQVQSNELPNFIQKVKKNVTCFSYPERGLSRSRNRLLSLSKSEILVISDNDIEFIDGAFDKIRESFSSRPEADIITFKMLTPDGYERKKYRVSSFQHGIFSIGKVSSCEIAIRRKSLASKPVKYDEEFGLGAAHPIGEEVIFLRDCLSKGMKIDFIPEFISKHPLDSSGKKFSEYLEFHRGALFYRLYGLKAYFIGPIFYLKKIRVFSSSIGLIKAINSYLKGISEFRLKNLPEND